MIQRYRLVTIAGVACPQKSSVGGYVEWDDIKHLVAPGSASDNRNVGQHWTEVAGERIRAGEPERDVMHDYGWEWMGNPATPAPAADVLALLAEDTIIDTIGGRCNDAAHDPRWCATCEARIAGIEDYLDEILRRMAPPTGGKG